MDILPKFIYPNELINDRWEKLIGIVNNEVWLSTKANRIIVLDLSTGELVHKFSWDLDDHMNGPATLYARIVGNKIVMFHQMLSVIDIVTKQEEVYLKSNTHFDKLKDIRIDRVSELQGDYLTFTADKLGTGYLSTVMGVLNAKTLRVEWVYEFTLDKKTSLSTMPPVLEGNKLYALDTKKNLHVFKEENVQD